MVIHHRFIGHKIIHVNLDLNCLLNCCLLLSDKSGTEQVKAKTKHKPVSKHKLHSIFLTSNVYQIYQREVLYAWSWPIYLYLLVCLFG